MHEVILSAGIDIGTSTTQLIFSKLTIENRASSYTVPRITIVDKEVIYRSDIYFTPLRSQTEIDSDAIKKIIEEEYRKAGLKPEDITTGAVIITGETARKKNADEVLKTLSSFAGDFVVATAGPDLESVLSGRGAGADTISKEKRIAVANIDIGGGTSNIAVFENGKVLGVTCLDIGGRLIKIDKDTHKITYIYTKIEQLAKENGIDLSVGDTADVEKLRKICAIMAKLLESALNITPKSDFYKRIFTNDGKGLDENIHIDAVTFSGGVADYVYNEPDRDIFKYGDIGIILGDEIRKSQLLNKLELYKSIETIRATVVGVGTHTTEISGSTISYQRERLPIKNIPILKISEEEEKSSEDIIKSIQTQLPLYKPEGVLEQVAIAFTGNDTHSFEQVQMLAQALIDASKEIIESPYPLILVIENDIAKAVGNSINFKLKNQKPVICIDNIKTLSGDYIDIGEPIADGRVVPVVIKTLIFNS